MQWLDEPPAFHSVTRLTSHAVVQDLAGEGVEQAKRPSLPWTQGHPLALDALPGADVVALAPRGDQG